MTQTHPDWFMREGGRIAHPFCIEENGTKVVWEDLAQFDHQQALAPDAGGPAGVLCRKWWSI